ncbi:MAG TPA: serine/threonine-protein kinase, partial [Dehalococcoidia bacterium]|nr:serine/threonine-protein kinase [Dehalococcoidia bacterium]
MIGQTLGRYEIVQELGRGGMATVYKALHPDLGRFVALKVLAPALSRDPAFVSRFKREATIAARLDHANIVPIYDIGESDESLYIAMRFVPGETLADLIAREGPLSLDRTGRILGQIAAALDFAHARGVVHRDLKPANILIEEDDRASLTDFGIAWVGDGTRLTQAGTLTGTPEYMAPEQAQGLPVNART